MSLSIFFALKPPSELAAKLVAIARDYASRCGGRPTRAETVHLTLAFLGEFPPQRVDELIDVAKQVRCSAFDLAIDRLGYWRHNQLLWAGSTSPPADLLALTRQLQVGLLEADCLIGRAREEHARANAFVPHVTLVRKLGAASGPADLAAFARLEWPCMSFALVRSQRTNAAATHELLHEFALDRNIVG